MRFHKILVHANIIETMNSKTKRSSLGINYKEINNTNLK